MITKLFRENKQIKKVYHGSDKYFNKFSYNNTLDEQFISFTDNKEVALYFSKYKNNKESFVYTVEIKFNKPAIIDYHNNVKFGKDYFLKDYIEAENEIGDPLYDCLILNNVVEGESGIKSTVYGIFDPNNCKILKIEKIA